MVFDRVIYRNDTGFPIENELVVNTTNAVNCCIACQNTVSPLIPFFSLCFSSLHPPLTSAQPKCAGSFYAPGDSECHLRLTEPWTPYPPSLPSASASSYLPSGTGALYPISTGTAGTGTCSKGSLGLYLGTIRGQTKFPKEYALSFSNGPCGRFSVSPVPLREWEVVNRKREMMGKRMLEVAAK